MNTTVIIDNESSIAALSKRCRALFDSRGAQEVIIRDLDNTRSALQNRLAFHYYGEIALKRGDITVVDARAYCKLHIGVPIRREEDAFREMYDKYIRPLSYEDKLRIMVDPSIDFPVTRDMKIKQMTRYLDDIDMHHAEQGIILSKPDDLYYGAMGVKR